MIIYEIEIYSDVGKIYAIKGRRIEKADMMIPREWCSRYRISCEELQLKEAVKILYDYALNKAKLEVKEAEEKLEQLQFIDISQYELVDATIPITPIEGELRL
jgi:hypothetical protein